MVETLDTKNVSFLELEVFSVVGSLGSVRAAARKLGLTPSNTSKILSRLEKKLGRPLLRRAASGVTLTREALTMLESITAVLELYEGVLSPTGATGKSEPYKKVLTIGSLSHLNKHVLAPIVSGLEASTPSCRFRLLDVPPDQIAVMATKGVFDIVVHTETSGKGALGELWSTTTVGKVEWGFFARPGHPLGPKATAKQVQDYPFIVPTYWQDGSFAIGNDFCPIPWSKRIKGHEASNAETAAHLVAWSNHVAYLPKTIVLRQARTLLEVEVEDVAAVSRSVHLAVQRDQVTAATQKAFASALKTWLEG